MNAKILNRNLRCRLNWTNHCSKRWGASNGRMVWGSKLLHVYTEVANEMEPR